MQRKKSASGSGSDQALYTCYGDELRFYPGSDPCIGRKAGTGRYIRCSGTSCLCKGRWSGTGGATPRPELPNAVPEDVQQVVKNFRPIADEASGMLRNYLKKARLSLAGDNRLMIVMPDALGADFVGREDRRKELESLIENRIGKKVEVEVRHVEEGRRFEDTFVDIEKKINMEIIVED